MDYLYRLSFDSQQDWHTLRNTLIKPNEDGTFVTKKVATVQLLTGETATINEVGNVPIPLEYDEETGNPLTEQLYHDDWAVDVSTPVLIPELNGYILKDVPDQCYNSWTGLRVIVEPQPDESWLKAEIQAWLDEKGIEWTTSMTKAELLELCH